MIQTVAEQIQSLRLAFRGVAIAPTSERSLNEWVRERLASAGFLFLAEVPLRRHREQALEQGPEIFFGGVRAPSPPPAVPRIKAAERIDFMVGNVGLELKVDGGNAEVLRQLDRYAASPDVEALVLITSRRRLASGLPSELRGKPLTAFCVGAL